MISRFYDDVDRTCPLNEYPRPQMEREDWLCLNGPWEYAITRSDTQPLDWEGTITVPFSPESELSGVRRTVLPDDFLWYRRKVPFFFNGKERVLIHFGAVDQIATLFVNGREAGSHRGGYTAFTFDITELLEQGDNELCVRVEDYFDRFQFARGKQSLTPGGIWYTPQSGIWQTVWCETVPEDHIDRLIIRPDFDGSSCGVTVLSGSDREIRLSCGEREFTGRTGEEIRIGLPGFRAWSPEDPYLYRFEVSLGEDRVRSYFGMRKFSVETAQDGHPRLFLNGREYFHNGLLDQGYWPDGLYTAPTDEAMIYDIETMKNMGFNTLRKHIKVEPDRWYYHCDRLGMLVWQDMPSGGGQYAKIVQYVPVALNRFSLKDRQYRLFSRDCEEGRRQYYSDLGEMIEQLRNFPSIAVWVPFNEGWGQFNAEKAVEFITSRDDSRTIDHASGWHDQHIGELQSLHIYFKPVVFREDRFGRAVCLTEFGGIKLRVPGHCFEAREFGYSKAEDGEDFVQRFEKLYSEQIIPAKKKGLAAAIYTQVSDVEGEVNGLLTYDRAVEKIPAERCRKVFEALYDRGLLT